MCSLNEKFILEDSTIIEDANENKIDEEEDIEEVKGDKKIQRFKVESVQRRLTLSS